MVAERIKNTVKQLFRLLRVYAKMDLLYLLRDTKYSLAYMASDSVISLSGIAAMLLLAERLGELTGFTRPELLFMLGCGLMVDGLYGLFFTSNNAGAISRIVGRGQLDHVLIQPVPLAVHFAANGFAPFTGTGPLITATVYTVWAATGLPGGGWLLLKMIPLLLLGLAIMMGWIFIISAIAFWAPYAAEEIAPEVKEIFTSLAPYPLGVLGKAAQFVLCAVVPVGAMAWLPASILLGKAPLSAAGLLAAVAAVTLLAAATLFRKGLKYYAKESCPRYTGFGR